MHRQLSRELRKLCRKPSRIIVRLTGGAGVKGRVGKLGGRWNVKERVMMLEQ